MNYDLSKQLLQKGYYPIPVLGKRPLVGNWVKVSIDDERLADWSLLYPDMNIGIRNQSAIDCDIYNNELAKDIVDWFIATFGDRGAVCVRYGAKPKFLIPINMEESRKLVSAGFTDKDGNINKVEILGLGNQWVAFGMHPDTEKDYEWVDHGGVSFYDTKPTDLPKLSLDDIRQLFDYFEQRAPEFGLEREMSRTDRYDRAVSNAAPIDSEQSKKETELTPPDDFNRRVDIGTLIQEYGWQDTGRSSLLDDGITVSREFTRPGKDDNSTGGTVVNNKLLVFSTNASPLEALNADETKGVYTPYAIYAMYECDGDFSKATKQISALGYGRLNAADDFSYSTDDETTLQRFLKRFVYIEKGSKVADIEHPRSDHILTFREFQLAYCNVPTKGRVSLVSKWAKHPNRITVADTRYFPKKPKVFEQEGTRYFNTFVVPSFEYTEKEDRIQPILDHIKYLTGDGYDYYLDFLANTIAQPHIRSTITPLLISTYHGTGRGFIDSMVRALLGWWNCASVTIAQLAGKGSNRGDYGNWFYETLYISVPEARAGGKRLYEVDDALREKLTAEYMTLNLKYGGIRYCPVFCQVHMASNYRFPLKLQRVDRRMYVNECYEKPKPFAYYKKIYNLIEDEVALAQLNSFFTRRARTMNWDAKANAKVTREKLAICTTFAETPVSMALAEMVMEDELPAVATYEIIRERITAILEKSDLFKKYGHELNPRQFTVISRGNLAVANAGERIKWRGKKVTVWILRDEKVWIDASPSHLRMELARWDDVEPEDYVSDIRLEALSVPKEKTIGTLEAIS